MPQLNPEFFLSQIFWLVITFSFLLIFLWRISLPRINSVLEKRENKINIDIKTAKEMQTEAEEIHAKINIQLHNAHEEITELIKKNTYDLQNKITNQLLVVDKDITKNINEASNTIEKNKNNTLKNINIQIQEITKLLLSKLTNINVSDKEINDIIQKI